MISVIFHLEIIAFFGSKICLMFLRKTSTLLLLHNTDLKKLSIVFLWKYDIETLSIPHGKYIYTQSGYQGFPENSVVLPPTRIFLQNGCHFPLSNSNTSIFFSCFIKRYQSIGFVHTRFHFTLEFWQTQVCFIFNNIVW